MPAHYFNLARILHDTANRRIAWFSLTLFFIVLADSMMAYSVPVVMHDYFQSALKMGLVLALSSVVGFCVDFFTPKIFPNQQYTFYLKWLIIVALTLPVFIGFLSHSLAVFMMGMAAWGIYYEFLGFSQFSFVARTVDKVRHAQVWSVLDSIKALGFLVGPFLAGLVLANSQTGPYVLVIISLLLALFFFWTMNHHEHEVTHKQVSFSTKSVRQQLAIWFELLTKMWPIYLFLVVLIMVDAMFWTIGPLISEHLRAIHPLGGLFISLYILPILFVPMIVGRLNRRYGILKSAFGSALVGAIVLGLGTWIAGESLLLLPVVFVSSLFISLDFPEIEAVFEDFFTRINGIGTDVAGLRNSAVSIGFVLGPVIAGALAEIIGRTQIIVIFSFLLMITAFFALKFVPETIRLPRSHLQQIVHLTRSKKRRLN